VQAGTVGVFRNEHQEASTYAHGLFLGHIGRSIFDVFIAWYGWGFCDPPQR
jgi:hypothetical protein